ncbi:MAG: hypothetical protein WD970_01485 [Patescibacteria group bacterium]
MRQQEVTVPKIATLPDSLMGSAAVDQIYVTFGVPAEYRDQARSTLANNLVPMGDVAGRDLAIFNSLPEDSRVELWEKIAKANLAITNEFKQLIAQPPPVLVLIP